LPHFLIAFFLRFLTTIYRADKKEGISDNYKEEARFVAGKIIYLMAQQTPQSWLKANADLLMLFYYHF